MPANVESMFSVRQMPWHREGTVLADYPGSWDEARRLAGLDWDPVTTEVYAVTSINGDGTPYLEPIAGWKSIARSDTGAVLSINRDSYTVIDHGEMGEIVEAVLAQPNVKWETAGVLDGGRSVWCLALLDEPITLPGDDSPRCRTWPSPTGTTAPPRARCAPPPSGSSAPTPSAPPNSKASAPAPPSPSSTKPTGATASSEARKAVTGAQAEMRRYADLARELLAIPVTPAQRELFITQFIPKPPDGLITDRVARNVDESRNALRLLFDTPTTYPVADTAYGLVQAAGEYLDHVRTARSWETRLNRTLIRPEPLKHRALHHRPGCHHRVLRRQCRAWGSAIPRPGQPQPTLPREKQRSVPACPTLPAPGPAA